MTTKFLFSTYQSSTHTAVLKHIHALLLVVLLCSSAVLSTGTTLFAQGTPANITFQNDRIMLNGQPFNMLGWYDLKFYSFGVGYRDFNSEESVPDVVSQMKNAGANTSLVAHNHIFDLFSSGSLLYNNIGTGCVTSYISYQPPSSPQIYSYFKLDPITEDFPNSLPKLMNDATRYAQALGNFLSFMRQQGLKVIVDIPLPGGDRAMSQEEYTFMSDGLITQILNATQPYNDVVIGYYNADEPEGKALVGLPAITRGFLEARYTKIKSMQPNKAVVLTQLGDRHNANYYYPSMNRMFDILMADIHTVYDDTSYPGFNMQRTTVIEYQKKTFMNVISNINSCAMAFVPGGYSDIAPYGNYSYTIPSPQGEGRTYYGAGAGETRRLRPPTPQEQMYLGISPIVYAQDTQFGRAPPMNGTIFWSYLYANQTVRNSGNSFLSFVRDNNLTSAMTANESSLRSQISLSYSGTGWGDMQYSVKEDDNAYYIFIVNTVFQADSDPLIPIPQSFTLNLPPYWAGRSITRLNLNGNTAQPYTSYCFPSGDCASMFIKEGIELFGTRVYRVPKIGGSRKNPSDEPTLDTPNTNNSVIPTALGVSLSVAPNPVQDILRVGITADQPMTANLVLFDVSGAIVYQSNNLTIPQGASSQMISVSALRAGTYTLRYVGSGGNATTSVVIVR